MFHSWLLPTSAFPRLHDRLNRCFDFNKLRYCWPGQDDARPQWRRLQPIEIIDETGGAGCCAAPRRSTLEGYQACRFAVPLAVADAGQRLVRADNIAPQYLGTRTRMAARLMTSDTSHMFTASRCLGEMRGNRRLASWVQRTSYGGRGRGWGSICTEAVMPATRRTPSGT